MKMKNGAFTGWKEVFNFTFGQNVKTKSFKVAFISLSLLMFVIFFGINICYGYFKDKDNKKEDDKEIVNEINKLYLYSDFDTKDIDFSTFKDYDEYLSELDIIIVSDKKEVFERIEKDTKEEIKSIAFEIYDKTDDECFEILVNQSEVCDDENVDEIVSLFEEYFEEQRLVMAGISSEKIQFVLSDFNSDLVNITEADKSLAEMLLELILPMVVVLIMYMLILLNGQSISKSLMIEKNSKLMEMLLISVKPYAIVLGKLLAMYLIAIIEILAWIISGIIGYIVSDRLSKELFEDYSNPISNVLDTIRKNAEGAFSTEAYVLCILAVLIGFLAYCILAGLITSNITKAEDLSNGSTVFQWIVVIAFMLTYLLPIMQVGGVIMDAMRYVPITSPFMLPSDILLGNISILGSIISLCILICSIIIMIFFTGKIYKKKLF